MEELGVKILTIKQTMQDIIQTMSWQGQTTPISSQQQAGMSSTSSSLSSPAKVLPGHQNTSYAEQSFPVGTNLFTSNYYQKLPHPFKQALCELPIIDGSDVRKLVDFLLRIIRMKQIGQMANMNMEILYPYCSGEVLQTLAQAMSAGASFDMFHEKLLTQFIPAR
jgi:hypothetical protein